MTRHYGRRAVARHAPALAQHQRCVAAMVRAGASAREAEGRYHRVIRAARRAGTRVDLAGLLRRVDAISAGAIREAARS